MWKVLKGFVMATGISLVPTVLIWLPFFLRFESFWKIPLPTAGMATIVANFDGPLYLVVAKTLYNKDLITSNFQFPLPAEYYSAHFPLFPLLIKLFGIFTNYPYAMLVATLFSSIIAIYFFYKLISDYVNGKDAIYLTFLFSIFPARWLVVRSVGSADPLFIAGIIASVYYFKNKKYLLSGLWGLIAQLTKSPGIILFVSYIVYLFIAPVLEGKGDAVKTLFNSSTIRKVVSLSLIPLGLILVFTGYYFTQGDFWAYFKSGDNIHLFFPPFQIFNYSEPWVGTFWLEEIIFIYIISGIGVYRLFEKKEAELAVFAGIFYILSLFIAHRDLTRYIEPLIPFLFVAFSDQFLRPAWKIAFSIAIIPIYLFSLTFISQNVMPISNWGPFL